MKRSILITLIMVFTALTGLFAQPPTQPEVANSSVSTLDLTTGKFNKEFPFDKPFTIHIKGIKKSYRKLQFTIVRNIGKLPAGTKPQPTRLTPEMVRAREPVMTLSDWERPADGADITEIDVVVPYKLKFNGDYSFYADPYGTRPLTAAEKQKLTASLKQNDNIANLISELAKTVAAYPEEVLSRFRDALNLAADQAVKSVDSTFVFNPPANLPQLQMLDTFRRNLDNMNLILKALSSNQQINRSRFVTLQRFVNNIDWGYLKKESSEYKQFSDAIDSLNNKKDNLPPTTVNNLKSLLPAATRAITARDNFKDELIGDVVVPFTSKIEVLNSTYRGDFVDNANFYITLDAGLAGAWRIDRALLYSGVNFYFRPIDKSIPFSNYNTFWEQVGVRTSLLLGLTFDSIEKEGVRKGLILNNKALVTGVGFRILPFMKLNGGLLVHYRYGENPLTDNSRYHLSSSPFLSFSFDLDIKPLLKGFGDALIKQ